MACISIHLEDLIAVAQLRAASAHHVQPEFPAKLNIMRPLIYSVPQIVGAPCNC
jgi:hypothetical protein